MKSHPSEERSLIDLRHAHILGKVLSVQTIDRMLPVELIVFSFEDNLEAIVSFYSTALLSIKSIFPKANCMAYVNENIYKRVDSAVFKNFESKGVSVCVV